MARSVVVGVVGGLLAVSCAGSESEPAEITAVEVTSTTVETAGTTTTSTTSPATTTSTTEPPSPSTVAPTTTASESTIPINPDAFDEAFAAYEQAWRATIDAQERPADDELRQRLRELIRDPALGVVIGGLDEQLETGLVSVEREEPADTASLEKRFAAVSEGGTGSALFSVCIVETNLVVESESGEVIFDDVIAYTNDVEMVQVDGTWFLQNEGIISFEEGTECVDER